MLVADNLPKATWLPTQAPPEPPGHEPVLDRRAEDVIAWLGRICAATHVTLLGCLSDPQSLRPPVLDVFHRHDLPFKVPSAALGEPKP
jgi:hypothetical protein